jgi:hypothetical protein
MSIMKIVAGLTTVALVSACASSPETVAPTHVSNNSYSNYSCSALNKEAQIINAKLAEATGRQAKAAKNDATLTAVSLILFWPAAFWIGNKDGASQLAHVKGTAEAINRVATRKGC